MLHTPQSLHRFDRPPLLLSVPANKCQREAEAKQNSEKKVGQRSADMFKWKQVAARSTKSVQFLGWRGLAEKMLRITICT